MASTYKGQIMVVAINVGTGEIYKVKGVTQDNVVKMNQALDQFGFEANEESNYPEIKDRLSKGTDRAGFLVHTKASPGCQWVLQDGWWRYVCDH